MANNLYNPRACFLFHLLRLATFSLNRKARNSTLCLGGVMPNYDLDFFSIADVQAAKDAQKEVLKTPLGRELSQQAIVAMQEIEDIYWGSGTYDPKRGVFTAKN